LQTGDLHIQVAENSVMLGALFAGLTVYPQGARQAPADSLVGGSRMVLCMHALYSYVFRQLIRVAGNSKSTHLALLCDFHLIWNAVHACRSLQ
jgi:hypothetical protein